MKTYRIPNTDLDATRIAYGCMPIGGAWDSAPLTDETRGRALDIVQSALDQGINFYDHADIYCRGKSEEAFAGIWKRASNLRQRIYVQSKCGICFEGVNAVRRKGFSLQERGRILELLTIECEGDGVVIVFAGGAMIRLEGAGITCRLKDMGEPWPTRWRPNHPAGDVA